MNCPGCGDPMIVLEIEEIEIDHCTACGGVWLDAGELELLLDDGTNTKELIASLTPVQSAEEKVRCPICSKKLDKVEFGTVQKILLDRCPRNDGIWFDEGELHDVLRMGNKVGAGRVYKLLNGVFGEKA